MMHKQSLCVTLCGFREWSEWVGVQPTNNATEILRENGDAENDYDEQMNVIFLTDNDVNVYINIFYALK